MLMKKIFTFIVALAMSLGAFATDYTDSLVVTVNGVAATPQLTTISVTANADGTYNFALKNFTFMNMNLGDINMNNVPSEKRDGVTYLNDTQNVQVSFLGKLPVTLHAELYENETKMYAAMDITVAALGQTVHVTFGKQQTTTGINAVATKSPSTTEIFDLSGRRVNAMRPGQVYVVKKGGKAVKVQKR